MRTDINDLQGKVFSDIRVSEDEIQFICEDGLIYTMYHSQDCCESVYVDDINGDVKDLIGSPILKAEELTNEPEPEKPGYADTSYTWTFYHLATIKGYVTIRWFGTSNGYYSESVDIKKQYPC